jgi:hypothetical protein
MNGPRTLLLLFALGALACGKVKDPTPKGATLFEWDRATARLYDESAKDQMGGAHPLAAAKILEGPEKHGYRVTVSDSDGKSYAFDVDIDAAKVSYPESGEDTTRWATVHATAKVVDNAAYHLTGSCDDKVATVLGAPKEVTNTVLECRVVGKRPNSVGTADAITYGAMLQIEGSGKILDSNDPAVKVVAR